MRYKLLDYINLYRPAGREGGGQRRRSARHLAWESLESRALMATLFPGNPISIVTPTEFSGTGGTSTSGGALDALNAFKAALGGGAANTAAAPQAGGFRTINWDGVKTDGTDSGAGPNSTFVIASKTVGISLNRFQGQGTFFLDNYAVSGDGFTDVNPNVTATTLQAFSKSNTFAMYNVNAIFQSFVLPSAPGTDPVLAGTRGFGAIFINNEVANTSSIEFFHGDQSLGKFFVPANPTPGAPEFLGELWPANMPVVTTVALTPGTASTGVVFDFKGTTATPAGTDPTKLVTTDDQVYAEPVAATDVEPVTIQGDFATLPGATGTLNAAPKATATVATPFTGVVATFNDTNGTVAATPGEFQATINWGDGHLSNGTVQANAQGGFDVLGTNTYGSAGLIPASVLIKDDGGAGGAPDLLDSSVIEVAAATTTTTLTGVTPSPAVAGQVVTLTAQVSPSPGAAADKGFVLLEDNGLPLGTAAVDSTGAATFTTTRLSPGTHNLSAVYLGTADFTTSTSNSISEVVRSDVTSQIAITFGPLKRRGGRFLQHVTLHNTGTTLPGPLVLVLDNLGRGAKLVNASGVTANAAPLGSPFIIVLDSTGRLASGASVGVDLILTGRPKTVRFTPRVLAGLSQP
jgi:hypothetical protein